MVSSTPRIPTIDLSPYFNLNSDQEVKLEAMKVINQACSEYGFFHIVNHGVPTDLMTRALELSTTFLNYPDEEKVKCAPQHGAALPAGYCKQPDHSVDKNDYFLMLPPESKFNVYPENPPEFKGVLEDVFLKLAQTGSVVESILNDCLGLAANKLQDFNDDRSWDFMFALRYYTTSEDYENGLAEHEDPNCFTFVFQDDAGGLEVRKNGEWIPVEPTPGAIIVNVGDVIQVLSNDRYKSAPHRVMRKRGKSRISYAFFHNLHGDKWVEPWLEFTTDIGELSKYRGFYYKDYQKMRLRNKTHPPSRPEDAVNITHYAIRNIKQE